MFCSIWPVALSHRYLLVHHSRIMNDVFFFFFTVHSACSGSVFHFMVFSGHNIKEGRAHSWLEFEGRSCSGLLDGDAWLVNVKHFYLVAPLLSEHLKALH